MPARRARTNRSHERRDLAVRESSFAAPERIEARAPERLVGIDVPEPGDDPLIEEHGLEWRPSASELRRQPPGREPRAERLRAVLRREVRLELGAVEHEPRAEAPHVSIREPRAVVELERRRARGSPAASGSPRSCAGGREGRARSRVEASKYLPRRSTATTTSPSSSSAISKRSYGRVSLGSRISTRTSVLPLEPRRELRADRLDLRQLGHPTTRRRRAGFRAPAERSSPISYAARTASTAADRRALVARVHLREHLPRATTSPRFSRQTTPTA